MKVLINDQKEMLAFEPIGDEMALYPSTQPTLFADDVADVAAALATLKIDAAEGAGMSLVDVKHEQKGPHFEFSVE